MEDKFYTIDQVAEMLGLHHKTIRKFITEGKLRANKVGKQWRITGHDLSVFMEKDNAGASSEKINEELNVDCYTADEGTEAVSERISVSSVIDIKETKKDEYLRISNTLIALANCKDPEIGKSSIHIKYDEKDRRTRVILWGSVKFIENMLNTVSMLTEQQI